MKLDQLRLKFFRRAFSPIEILYDLSRHWVLVVSTLAIGTLIMMGVISSRPPTFKSSATLVVSPKDVDLEGSRRAGPGVDPMAFISEQMNLLASDTVVEKAIRRAGGPQAILKQEQDLPDRKLGFISQAYRQVTGFFEEVGQYFDAFPPIPPESRQVADQAAAREAFRRLSAIENAPRSNIVRVSVLGSDNRDLARNLQSWIDGYKERIAEMSMATLQTMADQRVEYWKKEQDDAKKAMDAKLAELKEKYKGIPISVEQKRYNEERIVRLSLLHDEIQRGGPGAAVAALPGVPGVPGAPPATLEETLLGDLIRRRAALYFEQAELEGRSPKTSAKVRSKGIEIEVIERNIRDLQARIAAAGAASKAGEEEKEKARRDEEAAKPAPKSPEDAWKERLAGINDEIQKTLAINRIIDQGLNEISAASDDLRLANDKVRLFKSLKQGSGDYIAARQLVDIQIQDAPMTDPVPIPTKYVANVSLGSLAGLFAGVFLAFALEFFSGRIRYRKDIEEELGLEVVGVIPEN
jgi:hypothetical protein